MYFLSYGKTFASIATNGKKKKTLTTDTKTPKFPSDNTVFLSPILQKVAWKAHVHDCGTHSINFCTLKIILNFIAELTI